jgi:hypothetical protein
MEELKLGEIAIRRLDEIEESLFTMTTIEDLTPANRPQQLIRKPDFGLNSFHHKRT